MRISYTAHNLFAEFFYSCDFCEADEFPSVQIYSRRGAWIITNILMIDGITIGRHIFINPRTVWRDRQGILRAPKLLIAHELVHTLQYQRDGFWGFLWKYLSDFLSIFRRKKKWTPRTWFESYMEIPYEVEAREKTSEFAIWFETEHSG